MSNSNEDGSENSFRKEQRDTSVAPLKKFSKQAKRELEKAEKGVEAIDFLTDLLEEFLKDYGGVEEIDTKELKQIIKKYRKREEELIEIVYDRECQLESFSNNKPEETVEESEEPDDIEEGISKLEDSVSELEQLSDLSSSVMVAPQNCFLGGDKIDEVKGLIQDGLPEKELEAQVAKLGDFYSRIEDREEFKVLIVGKKGQKGKKCEFKIE